VFYVPSLKATLISSKELTNKGWEITFKAQKAVISHPKLGLNVTANWNQKAYYLNVLIDYNALEKVVYSASSQSTNKITLDLIHQRINHLNKELLTKTIDNTLGLSDKLKKLELNHCDPCFIGKFHEKGNKTPMSRAPNLTVFDVDIAGPFRPLGPKGEAYFLNYY
jgi:hypothetical protein